MNQQFLLEKFAAGVTTPEENKLFNEWFDTLNEAEQKAVLADYELILSNRADYGDVPGQLAEQIAARIKNHEQQQQRGRIFSMLRLASAAAVLLLVAGAVWYTFSSGSNKKPVLARTVPVKDKAPASAGAILTLADGTQIVLDSSHNGDIATQGNVIVSKQGGKILYVASPDAGTGAPVTYNTMTTPRGRQFQLVLPDGSKVWLNAASSVRYPTVFNGVGRSVEITGEAYFEVVPDPSKPFKVYFAASSPENGSGVRGSVEVLGTHFNINAYGDEPAVTTTLVEGSVKVAGNRQRETILTPGQQASISSGASSINVKAADITEVMAWKNGRFQFNEAPFAGIMRQVARWYDVDVIYEGTIPEKKYTADLSRQTKLSEFLKVLELSGIRFFLDADTLHVKM